MTSSEGAILILPEGAIRVELEDKKLLEKIREYAARYALEWCKSAGRDTLYLITAVFKSNSWTLGSFFNGSCGDKILVHRRPDGGSGNDSLPYHWQCQTNVDDQQGPKNNHYPNQTVLIKGFKMTVRWDWLPIIQRAEMAEWWLVCFLTSLWWTISRQWLSRIGE